MTEAKRRWLRKHRPERFRWVSWEKHRWYRINGRPLIVTGSYSWEDRERFLCFIYAKMAMYKRRKHKQ